MPTPQQSPTEVRKLPITITLGELYDILFDIGNVDSESNNDISSALIRQILSVDTYEIIFHGELDNAVIWRTNAWRTHSERIEREKAASIERRKIWNLETEATRKLADCIIDFCSLQGEVALALAKTIILKRDLKKAKMFDVDLESEEWKELLKK